MVTLQLLKRTLEMYVDSVFSKVDFPCVPTRIVSKWEYLLQ